MGFATGQLPVLFVRSKVADAEAAGRRVDRRLSAFSCAYSRIIPLCRSTIPAYVPFFAKRVSWVPRSMMLPWSRTMMSSASFTVWRRWAMTMRVLCSERVWRASEIFASENESSADVGSSRMMISGSERKSRAIARRWRSPPERRTHFSPISVSRPCASCPTNPHCARSRADRIISMDGSVSRP